MHLDDVCDLCTARLTSIAAAEGECAERIPSSSSKNFFGHLWLKK
jgi:hypothetical protein